MKKTDVSLGCGKKSCSQIIFNRENRIVIGVTGGIGSGKSAVLDILEKQYSCVILRTDDLAKELMQPGGACFARLVEAFGEKILLPDGNLDKACYADLIYQDEALLKLSDSIVHPAVWEEVRRRIACTDRTAMIAVETALPGTAFYSLCNTVWYVHAEAEVRIRRLMRSRGLSRARCREIMASQRGETAYRNEADAVIDNSGTRSETKKQIEKLVSVLLSGRRGAFPEARHS